MHLSQSNTICDRKLDVARIVDILTSVLKELHVPTSLHQPLFVGNENSYLKDCVDTGWVSSAGAYVQQFEKMLAMYTGAKRAVAVVNGTSALHIGLKLVGVKCGDEVLVPALTFVATANAVTYCEAIPHFVDCEIGNLGMNAAKLESYLDETAELKEDGCFNRTTGRRIKAAVPMHTFGHPVDMDPLIVLCDRWKIEVVEDAAEGLGSFYKGRHTGTMGRVGILSFNGNKIVTTGGGGALLFRDEDLANLARHITTTARCPHPWKYFHDQQGYNYRMPNLNAALGCAQLEHLPEFLDAKRRLTRRYIEAFKEVSGLRVLTEPLFAKSNYWLNALILNEEYVEERDAILEATHLRGIMTRPVWELMSDLPMFEACPRMDLSIVANLSRRIINIPSSATQGVISV
jgi:perosamine synthetase